VEATRAEHEVGIDNPIEAQAITTASKLVGHWLGTQGQIIGDVMLKAILMLLLAVVSSSAMAEWVEIRISKDGNATAYVDASTNIKNGSKVKMWALLDFRFAKITGGNAYLSTRQQHELDCKKKKTRLLTFSLYSGNMGDGRVVYRSSSIGNWDVVSKNGLDKMLLDIACGKK
jgi:hypothetical protein